MVAVSSTVTQILKNHDIKQIGYLPCERLKALEAKLAEVIPIRHLTRESTGIGLAFGRHLGGRRSAMLIQSTGLGNLITELITLPELYQLPLPIMVSWRGHGNEQIEAQTILGKRLTGMLAGLGIPFYEIEEPGDLMRLDEGIRDCYEKNRPTVFLFSPQLWQHDEVMETSYLRNDTGPGWPGIKIETPSFTNKQKPGLSRFKAIELILDTLDASAVLICQLGFPSREAFAIKDRDRNFYLLGALGSATLVGIGLAEARPDLKVMVIDGDGAYFFNPNQFFELRHMPDNLSVALLDNGAWGSTGFQPTLSASGVNLSVLGAAAGRKDWHQVLNRWDWEQAVKSGKKLVHFLIRPGNADVGTIPLTAKDIKLRFLDAIGMV